MPKLVVYHTEFGCDTGCCGHALKLDGVHVDGTFQFDHPYTDGMDDLRKWAEEFIRDALGPEHVADLDWGNCIICDD